MKISIQSAEAITAELKPQQNTVVVNRMPAAIVGIVLVALLAVVAFYIHDAKLSGALITKDTTVIIHESGLIPAQFSYNGQSSFILENALDFTVLVHLGTLCTSQCEYTLEAGRSMQVALPNRTKTATYYVTHKKEFVGTIVPIT